MPALREFCIALLAGTIGAGGTVAVHKAKPAVARKATPAKPRPAPQKVQKAVQTAREAIRITECPTMPVPSLGPFQVQPLQQEPLLVAQGFAQAPIAGGGPTVRPGPLPPAPPIPDAPTWVQLVAGFGLIGLAVRRRDVRA